MDTYVVFTYPRRRKRANNRGLIQYPTAYLERVLFDYNEKGYETYRGDQQIRTANQRKQMIDRLLNRDHHLLLKKDYAMGRITLVAINICHSLEEVMALDELDKAQRKKK